jgi:hypothetical protein
MAAYTDTLGFYKGSAAFGAHADKRLGYTEVTVDFAKVVAARAAASATALAAADTLQVLQVPAGSLVLAGGMNVTEAEVTNTTATFDLGCTGGSPIAANAFANDIASNAVSVSSVGLAAPVLFTSADTIDLLLNTAAPTNAVVKVWALYFNCNS